MGSVRGMLKVLLRWRMRRMGQVLGGAGWKVGEGTSVGTEGSQNPRVAPVGRALLPPRCLKRLIPSTGHRTESMHFWNISREGYSLDNLLWCSVTAEGRNSSSCAGGTSWASISIPLPGTPCNDLTPQLGTNLGTLWGSLMVYNPF